MSGFLLFGGMLALLLAAVVWAALRAGDDTGVEPTAAERRDGAIEALRDLELEYRTGKVTAEEYAAVRTRLERAAVRARDEAAGGLACTVCAGPLSGEETFCPGCGASVDPSKTSPTG